MKLLRFGFSLILVVVLLASLGLGIGLKATQVECKVNDQTCPEIIVNHLQPLYQQSFFLSDWEAKVTEQLLNVPGYTLVSLNRRLPSTLVVQLQQNPALYELKLHGKNEPIVVDTQGYLYSSTGSSTLPQVMTSESEWTPQRHTQVSQVLAALSQEEIVFTQLELSGSNTGVVVLSPQTSAVLDLEAAAEDIKKLSLVLKGIEPGTLQQIQEIDVRYRLPVLRAVRTIPRHDS